MTGRRPSPDPKRPRDTRPPTRRPDPKTQPQPKQPPRPKNGLTVHRRGNGFVDYLGPAEAIVARAPAPDSELASRLAHLFADPAAADTAA